MVIAALIVAAGRGARLGAGRPKALVRLAGRTLLEHSLRAFADHPRFGPLVAAVHDPEEAAAALDPDLRRRVTLVPGGEERQDSVRRGLAAVGDAAIILIHDAARPLVPRAVIDAVLAAAIAHGAAVPVLPVADTIKRVAAGGAVVETVERADLRLAQTPQGFRTALLREAGERAARAGERVTDDAALVERAGGRVATVDGSARNIKITTAGDLRLAEAILRAGGEGGNDRSA